MMLTPCGLPSADATSSNGFRNTCEPARWAVIYPLVAVLDLLQQRRQDRLICCSNWLTAACIWLRKEVAIRLYIRPANVCQAIMLRKMRQNKSDFQCRKQAWEINLVIDRMTAARLCYN